MKSLLHFSYYMIRKYFQYRILAHVLSDKELLANLILYLVSRHYITVLLRKPALPKHVQF